MEASIGRDTSVAVLLEDDRDQGKSNRADGCWPGLN